jgi:hypothetical protein
MTHQTFYRADKRIFSAGDVVVSAKEFLAKNPDGSLDLERVFEEKRPKNLPPRADCLYVFSALSDAKKHWSKMTGGKLYEVAVADTDVLFEGDMSLVDLAFRSRQVSEEVEACADRYWQGKCSEKPVIEVLVRNATVLTVVSNNETERQAYFRSWAISST